MCVCVCLLYRIVGNRRSMQFRNLRNWEGYDKRFNTYSSRRRGERTTTKLFYFATFHNTEGSTDDNNDNGDDGDANTDDNDTYMHVTQLVRITTLTCWIVNYGVVVVSNSVVAALESTGVVTIYV